MLVKSVVHVPVEVVQLLAVVSSSDPAAPPCGGAADLSVVEQPPLYCDRLGGESEEASATKERGW